MRFSRLLVLLCPFLPNIHVDAGAAETTGLTLARIFTDHAVLQRGAPNAIWGTARPGDSIRVGFGGQTKTSTADARGAWTVILDPMPASAEGRVLSVKAGEETAERVDLLVGEVWLCGGQSNMERQLGPRPPQPPLLDWEKEVAAADFPQIRHSEVAHRILQDPAGDVTGKWVVCSPETAKDFTAVGYFFGRALHRDLKVPIGLLHSSWGGTGVATWVSAETIAATPDLKTAAEAKLAELTARGQGRPGAGTPSTLYQSMIAPLIPFSIKGVIWFQGESGAGLSVPYDQIFQVMIKDWRSHWGHGDFPFYFVQLPNGSPLTREAQARALVLPHTGMAITLDVGFRTDVHGPNKAPIGERLARLALAHDYGRGGESSGPLFASSAVEGGSIRVRFGHTGGGLAAVDGQALRYFLIAGADRKFVPAEAVTDGETVRVSSAAVPSPVAVRYAWVGVADDCNLFNGAGLPAAPFRTDDW